MLQRSPFVPTVLALLALWLAPVARSAVTDDEARQLGTTLTDVGAIREGNAEGTIPPYTGGLATPPPGYAPRLGARGGGPYVDPFADDKPLFSVTAKNMAQYADQLDEASKILLQRFPDSYRMDIYPSRRSAAFPKFVLDNTVRNVQGPRLAGDGSGVEGAHAQFPFPLPKNGLEALWNYQLRYLPVWEQKGGGPIYLVDANGHRTQLSADALVWEHAYWDTARPQVDYYLRLITDQLYPPARAGARLMSHYPLRMDQRDFAAWSYIPGQRRVRLAPELKYDALLSVFGGLLFVDEGGSLFGKLDRFDYKLLGRKEMFVPYNTTRFTQEPVATGALKSHHNPDVMRFERHRVWVVEGTLKAGERHANSKKVWLIDEDSWLVTTYYSYDQAGKVFRLILNGVFMAYDVPAPRNESIIAYDLIKGGFVYGASYADGYTFSRMDAPANPDAFFNPDALAGSGVR